MFLKNKNIIFKIRRSKVTDYAALSTLSCHGISFIPSNCWQKHLELVVDSRKEMPNTRIIVSVPRTMSKLVGVFNSSPTSVIYS